MVYGGIVFCPLFLFQVAMSSALTKREALNFCRYVLKMSESALKMSDRSVFLNEYALKYTKRIPFTSAFDNYFMNKNGFNWEATIKNPSLLVRNEN